VHKTKWNKDVAEKIKLINDGFVSEVMVRQLPQNRRGLVCKR
jgi:hypothetical protein